MFKRFRINPYWKSDRRKRRAERLKRRKRERAWRKRERKEWWLNLKRKLRLLVQDPSKLLEPTREQLERKKMKKYIRHERSEERKRWWDAFKQNPVKTLFPPRKEGQPAGFFMFSRELRKERRALAREQRKANRKQFFEILRSQELKSKFLKGFFYSTAGYLIAFMLIYVFYQLITIAVASSFNIPVIWYYYQLKFPLYTYSPLYTRPALVTIFAAGPALSMMLALVFLRLYFTEKAVLKRFQPLFLWGFVCGTNMFFGAYIAGFFTRTEFIYTSEWIFLSNMFDIEEIIFSSISFVMLIVIGRIVTPLFLMSSGSVTLIKPENRFFFILFQVVLPWLAGVVILFVITLPNYYFPLILKTLTPGLVVIPTLYMYNSINFENIHKSGIIQRNYFRWGIVIAVVAILFFYRILLSWGWNVG